MYLKKWDTIGVISLSSNMSSLVKHRIQVWIDNIKKMWLEVKFPKNFWNKNKNGNNFLSIEERLEDFYELLEDKNIKMIMSSIGWDYSNQLLRFIDWNKVKNNEKIFIWFSDMTVLYNSILKKTGIKTYYWHAFLTQICEKDFLNSYSHKSFKEMFLKNNTTIKIYPSKKYTDHFLNWFDINNLNRNRIYKDNSWFKWLRKGKIKWEIIWGCIPSINHLLWTEFLPSFEKKIFLIDIPESDFDIKKWFEFNLLQWFFYDLYNAWIFDEIKWIILGRLYNTSKDEEKKIYDLLLKLTKNIPILTNFDIWHTNPIAVLKLWSYVEVDSDKNYLLQKI